MGRKFGAVLDFLRVGALGAGAAMLLGLWLQGMQRLGFRDEFPNSFLDLVIPLAVGVAFAATLGLPERREREDRSIGVGGRIVAAAGATIVGAAIAGAITYGLTAAGIAERKLPPYVAVLALALVGVGVRRLPRSKATRIALGVVVGFFALTRILAVWPPTAHAITRRIFPFSNDRIRPLFDERCGQLCDGAYAKVVRFDTNVVYDAPYGMLECDARASATLEATKPFFQDACGGVHDTKPASSSTFTSYEECERRTPKPDVIHGPLGPSPCCAVEVSERRVGDRFDVVRTWNFVFRRWSWSGGDEAL